MPRRKFITSQESIMENYEPVAASDKDPKLSTAEIKTPADAAASAAYDGGHYNTYNKPASDADAAVAVAAAGPSQQGILDSTGAPITVGATVKLVGTVVAVDSTDTHFAGITFRANNPATAPWPAQLGNVYMPLSPLPAKPLFRADGSQLTIGS